ncbi:UPF0587 protein v1g245604 isoform X1 [Nematostella vectensis]|uniref:UPF0587 protein v1g245604 isoform X1 n=1 Tax=Nematostella vectensis TaxID=45351 RepID=UPI0013900773|nr:UPF0587 protein v1g245604 isoform X1 [Nematostella vectensis]
MVRIGLQLKANLENVTNLKAEGEDFRWYLMLKCMNCGEVTKQWVYMCLMESQPVKGGRGYAHFVSKCKLCHRENSVDIMKDSIHPYLASHNGKFHTIVSFDCRGVEPTDFSPRTGWTAEGENTSTPFEVDLTEKAEYQK